MKKTTPQRSNVYSFRPKSYGSLKDAEAALIDANGGLERSADKCRVGKTQLSDYMNPYKEDIHMPVDITLQLERGGNLRAVTEHLAFEHNCVLVQLPNGDDSPKWLQHIAEAAKENGEALAKIAEGMATEDYAIPNSEIPATLKEVDESLAAMAAIRVALVKQWQDTKESVAWPTSPNPNLIV